MVKKKQIHTAPSLAACPSLPANAYLSTLSPFFRPMEKTGARMLKKSLEWIQGLNRGKAPSQRLKGRHLYTWLHRETMRWVPSSTFASVPICKVGSDLPASSHHPGSGIGTSSTAGELSDTIGGVSEGPR